MNIWTYGDIEFHFKNQELYLIYSDYWYNQQLKSGTQLKLNKWIFKDINKLMYVLSKLNEYNIDYRKKQMN